MQFMNYRPQQQLQTLFGGAQQPMPQNTQQGFQQWLQQNYANKRSQDLRQGTRGIGSIGQYALPFNAQYAQSNPMYNQWQQQYGLQQAMQQMFPQYAQAVPSLFNFQTQYRPY